MMFKSIQIVVGSSSGFVSHRFKPTHGSCGLSLISVSITRPFLSSSCASFTATTYSVLRLPKSSLSKNSPCCFRAIRMSLTNPESNPDGSSSISSSSAPSSSSVMFHSSGSVRKINFCQSCGGPTKHEIPDGEEKIRAVCTLCGRIVYENPKMVVGCLVEHDNKILLCKRNIQPSYGLWTLPAGYMEMGESATEGAIRETLEEANAEVEVLSPFVQLDIPLIGQTYIIFLAKLKKPNFSPGPESLECQLFALGDIPFDSLAFSSMLVTLSLYVEDRKVGQPKFHYGVINKRPGTSPSDIRAYTLDHHMQSSYN